MQRHEYERRLEFEHELIGRRIGWLLTAQGLLFAAYSLALGTPVDAVARYREAIPAVGAVVAVAVLVGVFASASAKYHTWRDFTKHPDNAREPFGVRTWITCIGLIPDFSIPLLFAIAWLVLA